MSSLRVRATRDARAGGTLAASRRDGGGVLVRSFSRAKDRAQSREWTSRDPRLDDDDERTGRHRPMSERAGGRDAWPPREGEPRAAGNKARAAWRAPRGSARAGARAPRHRIVMCAHVCVIVSSARRLSLPSWGGKGWSARARKRQRGGADGGSAAGGGGGGPRGGAESETFKRRTRTPTQTRGSFIFQTRRARFSEF